MEKKQIKLSTQKKLMFIPFFNFLIIYMFTMVNLGWTNFKDNFKLFFKMFLVSMIFLPWLTFLEHVNISDELFFIIFILDVYLLGIVESWVLIKHQEKMDIEKEKAVVKMEKKQIKLSTQKILMFIPFISFFIIYIFTYSNLQPLTFKEMLNIFLKVFWVALAILPFFVLLVCLDNSKNLFSQNQLAVIMLAFAYVISIAVSLVLIKYQKKMGVK